MSGNSTPPNTAGGLCLAGAAGAHVRERSANAGKWLHRIVTESAGRVGIRSSTHEGKCRGDVAESSADTVACHVFCCSYVSVRDFCGAYTTNVSPCASVAAFSPPLTAKDGILFNHILCLNMSAAAGKVKGQCMVGIVEADQTCYCCDCFKQSYHISLLSSCELEPVFVIGHPAQLLYMCCADLFLAFCCWPPPASICLWLYTWQLLVDNITDSWMLLPVPLCLFTPSFITSLGCVYAGLVVPAFNSIKVLFLLSRGSPYLNTFISCIQPCSRILT